MSKILTVSIAAYNMEKYIRQALDSLIDDEVIDKLEIFVVDDGGTDDTLAIAQEYAQKYPQSIFPVHKENEGYGSTVNYSIAHATGKYFKLLDGDDWFESDALRQYIHLLAEINTDVIITPYYKCQEGGNTTKSEQLINYKKNEEFIVEKLNVVNVFGMWAITYKTEILKDIGLKLPLHSLYTDQIYSTVPFYNLRTIRFEDLCIYCYRIGRNGQSVSKESRIRHLQEKIKLTDILLELYSRQNQTENISYIQRRTSSYANGVIKAYLLEPVSMDVLKKIKEYDTKCKENVPDIYHAMIDLHRGKFSIYLRILRMTRYGKIALFISKILLPKDGLESWA